MYEIKTYRFIKSQPILKEENEEDEEEWEGFIEFAEKIKNKLNKKKEKYGMDKDTRNSEIDPNEFNNGFEFLNDEEREAVYEIKKNVEQLHRWDSLKKNQSILQNEKVKVSDITSESSYNSSDMSIGKYNSIYSNVYSNHANFKRQKIRLEETKKISGTHYDKKNDLSKSQIKVNNNKANKFREETQEIQEENSNTMKMNITKKEKKHINNDLLSKDFDFENNSNHLSWNSQVNIMNERNPMKLVMNKPEEEVNLTYSVSEDFDSKYNNSYEFEKDHEVVRNNEKNFKVFHLNQMKSLSNISDIKNKEEMNNNTLEKEVSESNRMAFPKLNFNILDQYMYPSNISNTKNSNQGMIVQQPKYKKGNQSNDVENLQGKKVPNDTIGLMKSSARDSSFHYNNYNDSSINKKPKGNGDERNVYSNKILNKEHVNENLLRTNIESHYYKKGNTPLGGVSHVYNDREPNQFSMNRKKQSSGKTLGNFQNNEFRVTKPKKRNKKKEKIPTVNVDGTYSFNYMEHSSNESDSSFILNKSDAMNKKHGTQVDSLLMDIHHEMKNYQLKDIF